MNLVYYTVGYNSKYIDMLEISINSLRRYNTIDILIIADTSMVSECTKRFKNVQIVACDDSISAMDSSMKKLQIFKYDISKYEKVLFIDSDIFVDINLDSIFSNITTNKLYSYAEQGNDLSWHTQVYHSLLNYTPTDLAFFKDNKIYVLNAGIFGFLNTPIMKEHFDNILELIKNHTGTTNYWYEQSFMNVYFNLRNLTDLTVINNSNYIMNFDSVPIKFSWNSAKYRNKLVHFSIHRSADIKLSEMRRWVRNILI